MFHPLFFFFQERDQKHEILATILYTEKKEPLAKRNSVTTNDNNLKTASHLFHNTASSFLNQNLQK